MIRSLTLFVHVVGVLGLFVGLGLESLVMGAVRRSAQREEAVRWIGVNATVARLTGIAFAVAIASGFYLGARVGVLGDGWVRASYGALLLMGIVAGPITRPRIQALQRAVVDPNGGTMTALRAAASDSILRASVRVRVVFGLAVVYLMIGKPDASGSLLVLGLASIAAVVMAVSMRQPRSQVGSSLRATGTS
jgi:hypothetical protein